MNQSDPVGEEKAMTLMPCPFCGKQPEMDSDDVMWSIFCANEECIISATHHTRERAIEAWNTRNDAGRASAEAELAQKDAEIKELREFRDATVSLQELHATPSHMKATIDIDPAVSRRMIEIFASTVLDSKNYTEMQLTILPENGERMTVTVQKHGKDCKTPHELRMLAEAERDALKAALVEASKWLYHERKPLPSEIAFIDEALKTKEKGE